jgi:geranylgeranyl diphosphate synthase type II
MDQAPVRRNFPTVHTKWNTNQAVLSGDVMAFIANECFLQAPSGCLRKVLSVYNKAAIEVCVGQQLDVDFEKLPVITLDEYLRMIELKTAALIAASAMIGSIIGGAADKDSDLLYQFGRNLGLAFQIQDDLLDLYGDASVFGKIPGGDIVANKKTFLLVKAFETASVSQMKKLQELFSSGDTDPGKKVEEVTEIYDRLNIRNISENRANEHISIAFGKLDGVNVNKERKEEIARITMSLIGRDQ